MDWSRKVCTKICCLFIQVPLSNLLRLSASLIWLLIITHIRPCQLGRTSLKVCPVWRLFGKSFRADIDEQCDHEKVAKCLYKLPNDDFTRKVKDFDIFTKIAYNCGQFGQNNCCHMLWKVAQSAKNLPIWSHCWRVSGLLLRSCQRWSKTFWTWGSNLSKSQSQEKQNSYYNLKQLF